MFWNSLFSNLYFLYFQVRYDDDDDDDGPAPDPALEGGMPVPIRMAAEFPPEFTAIPLEDIDSYYQNKKVLLMSLFKSFLNVFSLRRRRETDLYLINPYYYCATIIKTLRIGCMKEQIYEL